MPFSACCCSASARSSCTSCAIWNDASVDWIPAAAQHSTKNVSHRHRSFTTINAMHVSQNPTQCGHVHMSKRNDRTRTCLSDRPGCLDQSRNRFRCCSFSRTSIAT